MIIEEEERSQPAKVARAFVMVFMEVREVSVLDLDCCFPLQPSLTLSCGVREVFPAFLFSCELAVSLAVL